jgi:phospholipid/cholesterol/gamma-HCH transport system permease protein
MPVANEVILELAEFSFSRTAENGLMVILKGHWIQERKRPPVTEILSQLNSDSKVRTVAFDSKALADWDSTLLTFLTKIVNQCRKKKIRISLKGLPNGAQRMLKLAFAVPEKKGARKEFAREHLAARIGGYGINAVLSSGEILAFLGEAFVAFLRFLIGKARFRRSHLILYIQEAGAQALPIVTLISVLVGLILAFVGAVQLKMFGAQIYVANLVGLAMVREMGAIMCGIIMAGRTGSAYAAQIGTMQVNEEIDALKTMGISPMEFLALPRMMALVLMMPLLCIYADFMGILGGSIVGVGMLDITLVQYFNQTRAALDLTQFGIGVFKAGIFGILIAVTGCLEGIRCARSASAVGDAATAAVVSGIIYIIVADALTTLICNELGI